MTDEHAQSHWAWIEEANAAADANGKAELLVGRLKREEPRAIAAFDHWFWAQMQRLYIWEFWGVATLAGHTDEEAFMGFRAWIISLGQEAVEAARQDADSLASHIVEGASSPKLCYAGRDAYESVMDSELPTPTLDLFAEPRGERIKESELTTRFPKVATALAR